MTVEDQLRQAMAEQAAEIPKPSDGWADIEARATAIQRAEVRRRNRQRAGTLTVFAVAATAAAALVILPALNRTKSNRVVLTPGHQNSTVVTPNTTTPAPQTPGTTTATPGSSSTVPAAGSGYLPLYPFPDLQQAQAWEVTYLAGGAQAWHLDPGQTALSFTSFLGYGDITTVFGVSTDSTGAHVTVGFPNPNGGPVDAAVVHLRRFGTGSSAPWEVVGTDDTPTFSLTSPRYGATVTSPLSAGGAFEGVDAVITVQVRQLSSSAALGVSCCTPAGSSGLPWGATVTFRGATDKVVIVAASADGGLEKVGRFTVTGVRTTPGTTPGL